MKQIGGGLMVPTQRSPADDVRRTKACDEIEAALRELGAEVPRVPIPRRASRFRAAAWPDYSCRLRASGGFFAK